MKQPVGTVGNPEPVAASASSRSRKAKADKAAAPPKLKAAEAVAAHIRAQIVSGNLQPGDKLLTPALLQSSFGVSRPTLREALRVLEAESLIRMSRGKKGGAFVTALDPRVTAKQVGVLLQVSGVTLQDVLQARMALEPFAARLLATSRDPDAIGQLEAATDKLRGMSTDPIGYGHTMAEFAAILARSCGNKTIELLAFLIDEIVRREQEQAAIGAFAVVNMEKLLALGIRSREKLIAMLKRGDADEAEKFWREHLEGSTGSLAAYRARMPIDVMAAPPEGAAGR